MGIGESQELEEALLAWQRERSMDRGKELLRISDTCLSETSVQGARSKATFHELWMEIAANDPGPVATGWLAKHVLHLLPEDTTYRYDGERRFQPFSERTGKLLERGPDLRIANCFVDILENPPLRGSVAPRPHHLYHRLVAGIVAGADASVVQRLREILRSPRATYVSDRTYLADEIPRVLESIRNMFPFLENVAPSPRPTAPGRDEATLLAVIRADPADLDARLVYGDLLQETGNPLGEFIALQMHVERAPEAEAQKKRVRELEKEHRRTWLGNLDQVFRKIDLRNGFLYSAALQANHVAEASVWNNAVRDPRLLTLRKLSQGSGSLRQYRSFLVSEFTRNLDEIFVPNWATLGDLIDSDHRRSPTRLVLPDLPNDRQIRKLRDAKNLRPREIAIRVEFPFHSEDDQIRMFARIEALASLGLSENVTRFTIEEPAPWRSNGAHEAKLFLRLAEIAPTSIREIGYASESTEVTLVRTAIPKLVVARATMDGFFTPLVAGTFAGVELHVSREGATSTALEEAKISAEERGLRFQSF